MLVASITNNRGDWEITQNLEEATKGDEIREAEPDELTYFAETGEKSFDFNQWSQFWGAQ